MYGINQWKQIAAVFPGRSVRQLRERWKIYLDPQINKSPFSEEEDQLLVQGQLLFGNHWKIISQEFLPNRSDIALRNRFYQIQKDQDNKDIKFPSIEMLLNLNHVQIALFPLE
jgi:myb proto-oncogene protein